MLEDLERDVNCLVEKCDQGELAPSEARLLRFALATIEAWDASADDIAAAVALLSILARQTARQSR